MGIKCKMPELLTFDEWKKLCEKKDNVEKPNHYCNHKYETWDILLDYFPNDPIMYNIGKYILRAPYKGKMIEDLKKAKVYIDKKLEMMENKK